MNWFAFISNLVGALAWPVTTIVAIYFLRKDLPSIIQSLSRLKYKDLELEFREATREISIEMKELLPDSGPTSLLKGLPKSEITVQLTEMAKLSPRAAILEAWLKVESSAANVVRSKSSATLSAMAGPFRLRQELEKVGALAANQIPLYEQLRTLRNQAVHFSDAQFSEASVKDYVDSALAMAAYLESIANES